MNQSDPHSDLSELHNELDIRFSEIIEHIRKTTRLSHVVFSGAVSGFLIKTGIYLAANGGCPDTVLLIQLNKVVKEAYKGK